MGDKEKYEIWGLSLSLKPPITNIDQKLPICKREAQFFTDEQSRKMQNNPSTNKTLIMPRINKGVDIKPPLVEIIGKLGSPNNSTLLLSSGNKRKGGSSGEREMISSDDDEGGHCGGSGGEHGGCGGGRGESKKLRLSKEQIMVLEQAFREHTTLNTKRKMALAKRVNLKPRQVEVWFQNRRARTKLKQTELDCEYLRRFCKSLTEENKKLQKEVHELRAAIPTKVSPTNLTMCPSCNTMSFSSPATVTKTLASEMARYHAEIRHPHVSFNLKKLPLTIKKNRTFETHNPHS